MFHAAPAIEHALLLGALIGFVPGYFIGSYYAEKYSREQADRLKQIINRLEE